MAQSKQQFLADAEIDYQVGMVRYSNGVVRRMIALLNAVDADLIKELAGAIGTIEISEYRATRIDALLSDVRAINEAAYQSLYAELTIEIKALASYEMTYQADLFDTLKIQYSTVGVTPAQVYTAAIAQPFQGRLLKEWASGLEEGRYQRVRDAVRIGFVEGKTTDAIVREIRGTKAMAYADGLLEIDRRHATTIVRSAVSHTAATGRDKFYGANEDIIAAEQWTSTLDGKTSEPCRLRDGRRYTVGNHKPIGHSYPWGSGPGKFHHCCRSTSVPILRGFEDEPVFGTRASDAGQVKASTTFADWIKRQSAEKQDDILGPARGKLMREGGLDLPQFYNDKGKFLTLDELKTRHRSLFSQAQLQLPQ